MPGTDGRRSPESGPPYTARWTRTATPRSRSTGRRPERSGPREHNHRPAVAVSTVGPCSPPAPPDSPRPRSGSAATRRPPPRPPPRTGSSRLPQGTRNPGQHHHDLQEPLPGPVSDLSSWRCQGRREQGRGRTCFTSTRSAVTDARSLVVHCHLLWWVFALAALLAAPLSRRTGNCTTRPQRSRPRPPPAPYPYPHQHWLCPAAALCGSLLVVGYLSGLRRGRAVMMCPRSGGRNWPSGVTKPASACAVSRLICS